MAALHSQVLWMTVVAMVLGWPVNAAEGFSGATEDISTPSLEIMESSTVAMLLSPSVTPEPLEDNPFLMTATPEVENSSTTVINVFFALESTEIFPEPTSSSSIANPSSVLPIFSSAPVIITATETFPVSSSDMFFQPLEPTVELQPFSIATPTLASSEEFDILMPFSSAFSSLSTSELNPSSSFNEFLQPFATSEMNDLPLSTLFHSIPAPSPQPSSLPPGDITPHPTDESSDLQTDFSILPSFEVTDLSDVPTFTSPLFLEPTSTQLNAIPSDSLAEMLPSTYSVSTLPQFTSPSLISFPSPVSSPSPHPPPSLPLSSSLLMATPSRTRSTLVDELLLTPSSGLSTSDDVDIVFVTPTESLNLVPESSAQFLTVQSTISSTSINPESMIPTSSSMEDLLILPTPEANFSIAVSPTLSIAPSEVVLSSASPSTHPTSQLVDFMPLSTQAILQPSPVTSSPEAPSLMSILTLLPTSEIQLKVTSQASIPLLTSTLSDNIAGTLTTTIPQPSFSVELTSDLPLTTSSTGRHLSSSVPQSFEVSMNVIPTSLDTTSTPIAPTPTTTANTILIPSSPSLSQGDLISMSSVARNLTSSLTDLPPSALVTDVASPLSVTGDITPTRMITNVIRITLDTSPDVVVPTTTVLSMTTSPVISLQESLPSSSSPLVASPPSSSFVSLPLSLPITNQPSSSRQTPLSSSSSPVIQFSSIGEIFSTSLPQISQSLVTPLLTTIQPPLLTTSSSVLATPIATPTPSLSPSPFICPSFHTPSIPIGQTQFVDIGLALISSEHSALVVPNHPRRCSLEAAMVDVFLQGLEADQGIGRGRKRRQVRNPNYDADISVVGAISGGTSIITFFILNATDTTSDPIPVPAVVVAMAFTAANVQEIDSYPIITAAAPRELMVTFATNSTPVATSSILVPLVAGVGGAVIFLLVIITLFCLVFLCYQKKKGHYTPQVMETGQTFSQTRDFGTFFQNNVAIQHGTPVVGRAEPDSKGPGKAVSLSRLANGWVEGMSQDRPPSKDLQVPAALFERVAHYDTPPPTGPSPPIRGLRARFRNSVAPSPSTSNKSQSSEGTVPAALRPSRPSARSEVAKKLREEALRLQEEQEEKELKLRRKATLERLMLQSRERDLQSQGAPRSRRRKRGTIVPMDGELEELPLPPRHVRANRSRGQGGIELELDAALGDIETSSPLATPFTELPAATSPRPSTRPSTKRRVRKKTNRVGPTQNTDGYDSTDHRQRPPLSRQSKRFKGGRNQRGRPFTQQSLVGPGGGRISRGIAYDTQQELAWLDTGGGGVQLMRYQPILPPPPPSYSLPPLPAQHSIVQVQPHPQTHPHMQHPAPAPVQEKLPTLAPLQSQSYTQRQLETYFRIHQEMEKLQLHRSTPAPNKAEATPPAKATPPLKKKTGEHKEQGQSGRKEEKRTEKEDLHIEATDIGAEAEKAETTDNDDDDGASSKLHPSPAPPSDPTQVPPDTTLDDSFSSTLHDLMQQIFNASGGGTRGPVGGARVPPTLPRENSVEQSTLHHPHMAWHPVSSQLSGPYQLYAPPPASHYTTSFRPAYTPTPGQILWAPTEPHPMAPPTASNHVNTQILSPVQLAQLRRNQDYGYPDQEHYNQSPQHLPSHSQVRSQTDPFQ